MIQQLKRMVYAGTTLDQEVMACTDPASGKIQDAKPKRPRFKDDAERAKHRMDMARRAFVRRFNATFHPGDIYATPTLDDEHEVHTFPEARRIRRTYRRRIKARYPDAVVVLVMGRGKSTNRIHFHLVAQGAPQEVLEELWTWGKMQAPRPLRVHNYYEHDGVKIDHGADYTGLATYLFNHWTPEQGGHYYSSTRNMVQPEAESQTEAKRRYSAEKPPKAPKGYLYIGCDATPYGYACYHYIIDPKLRC